MKDSLVITASGARVIPYLKVCALLPAAVLLTWIFSTLSKKFSQERVFYIMITGFLLFYAFFVFVLYPMQDWIHPNRTADELENILPHGLYGLVEMFRNWSLTLFYALAELWSCLVYSVLFMGFANEVTKITEARRFYTVLSVGSNMGAIFAGQAANYVSRGEIFSPNLPFGATAWEQTTMLLVLVVTCSGIVIMGIFWWMNRKVLNDPCFDELHLTRKEIKNKKNKLSVRESFSFLSNSKYLLCIATLVLAYNLTINLVEVAWKDQLSQLYPSASDLNHYMNNLTTNIGIVSTLTAFFMARILGRFGWTATAMITPAIMLVTSVGFFTCYLFQDSLEGVLTTFLGMTPLALVVFFGGAQNCLSKSAKYSVFDGTKEMAFIPLEHEVKLKGKAAIDGIGSRFGKSGGSIIYWILLMVFETLPRCAPYVAGILTAVIGGWIVAVKSLGRQFQALAQAKDEHAVEELEGGKVSSNVKEQPVTT